MGIFDRVKEVITVDISEKISYGNSIRKLSGEINANESAVKTLINQVGIRCVENHIDEPDSEYADLFSKILELRQSNCNLAEQIQILKEQQAEEEEKRRQQREEMRLAKQQKDNEKMQVSSVEQNHKICRHCGKPNDDDAAFCVHCGNPFMNETTKEADAKEDTDVL